MTPSQAQRLEPHGGVELARAASPTSSAFVSRLVLFDRQTDEDLYWGRASVRRAMLAMTPDDPVATGALEPPLGTGDIFWGLQAPNGLTVALGVGDYPDHVAARRHATAILGHADLLDLHPVTDVLSGRSGAWVTMHGRIVIVSGRSWRRPKTSAVASLKRVLRAGTLLHGAGSHHAPVADGDPDAPVARATDGVDAGRYLWT